jgi:hypothetical protein
MTWSLTTSLKVTKCCNRTASATLSSQQSPSRHRSSAPVRTAPTVLPCGRQLSEVTVAVSIAPVTATPCSNTNLSRPVQNWGTQYQIQRLSILSFFLPKKECVVDTTKYSDSKEVPRCRQDARPSSTHSPQTVMIHLRLSHFRQILNGQIKEIILEPF